MPSEARLEISKEKLEIRAQKFIAELWNCTLGPPILGVGKLALPHLPLRSASEISQPDPWENLFGCQHVKEVYVQSALFFPLDWNTLASFKPRLWLEIQL